MKKFMAVAFILSFVVAAFAIDGGQKTAEVVPPDDGVIVRG